MTQMRSSKAMGRLAMLVSVFLFGCDTPSESLERERSGNLDPAARDDIISDPAIRYGIHSINVYGSLGSIPPRMVYSSPVDAILVSYDKDKVTRDAVLENVASFCERNDFGRVTRVVDSTTTFQANITTTELWPTVQIECAGFDAEPLL